MNIKLKDIWKFIVVFVVFLYLTTIYALVARNIYNVTFANITTYGYTVIDLLVSTCTFFVVITIYYKSLATDLTEFKRNIKSNLKNAVILFILFMVVKSVSGTVSGLLGQLAGIKNIVSENQDAIEELAVSAPALMMISAVLIAPVVEEVIFRLGLRKLIKNKRVFITVSGLIFGLMHVVSSVTFYLEIIILGVVISLIISNSHFSKKGKVIVLTLAIVMILALFASIYTFEFGTLSNGLSNLSLNNALDSIVYITAGVSLAYIYVKTDNIYINIIVHGLNNLLSMVLIVLLLFTA